MKNLIPTMKVTIILFVVFVVTLLMTSCGPSNYADVPVLVKPVDNAANYVLYFSENQLRVMSVGDTVMHGDVPVVIIKIAAE